MSDEKDSRTEAVVALILFLPILIGCLLLRGYVITRLWSWFMSPLGVHAISISVAIGLSLLSSAFIGGAKPQPKMYQLSTLAVLLRTGLNNVFASLIFWLFGWLVVTYL